MLHWRIQESVENQLSAAGRPREMRRGEDELKTLLGDTAASASAPDRPDGLEVHDVVASRIFGA